MRKKDELANPDSCTNRARPLEWVFVLLGRFEGELKAASEAFAALRAGAFFFADGFEASFLEDHAHLFHQHDTTPAGAVRALVEAHAKAKVRGA